MNKFKLYQVGWAPLKQVRMLNRVFLSSIFLVLMVILFLFYYNPQVRSYVGVLYVFFLLFLLIGINIYSRHHFRRLREIGELELSYNAILQSSQGNYIESFTYDEVRDVLVYVFNRNILWYGNNDASKTYYVRINLKSDKYKDYIVSSQAFTKPEFNFVELLKHIKSGKGEGFSLSIKNNYLF